MPSVSPSVAPPMPADAVTAITAIVSKAIEEQGPALALKAVESALAARPALAAPVTSGGRDLMLDVPKASALHAALGYRMKSALLARADQMGIGKESRFDNLRRFTERVKTTGMFASIFDQGGSMVRETQSTDASLMEILRAESVLLRAGAMTVSDYGSRLTIGKLTSGVTVYWVAEGEPPTKSAPGTGIVSLGAHKVMALAPISNDLLRLGSMDAAALVGRDMSAAIAVEVDEVGIKGSGAKKPIGYRPQLAAAITATTVPSENSEAISGTAVADKIADLDELVRLVDVGNLPGGIGDTNSPGYLMAKATMYNLRGLRDSAGWVFEGLRDLKNPTINGFPVYTTTTVTSDARIDFLLFKFLMLGEAQPLRVELGEDTGNFAADMISMRAISEVDWLLRRPQAVASKTSVTY